MESFKFNAPQFGSSPIQFIKEVKAELKKVNWPTKKEVVRMTSVVIFVSTAVSLLISGLDFVFTKLMTFTVK